MSKIDSTNILIGSLLSPSHELGPSGTSEDTELPSGDAEFQVRRKQSLTGSLTDD